MDSDMTWGFKRVMSPLLALFNVVVLMESVAADESFTVMAVFVFTHEIDECLALIPMFMLC